MAHSHPLSGRGRGGPVQIDFQKTQPQPIATASRTNIAPECVRKLRENRNISAYYAQSAQSYP